MGLPIGHRNGVKLRRRGNGIYRIPKPHGIPFYNPSDVYQRHDFIESSETTIRFTTRGSLTNKTPTIVGRLRGSTNLLFAPQGIGSSSFTQNELESYKIKGETTIHFWQDGKIRAFHKMRAVAWIVFNLRMLIHKIAGSTSITFDTSATLRSYKLRGYASIVFTAIGALLNNLKSTVSIVFSTSANLTAWLATPTNLTAEAISDTAIRLNWDDNSTVEEGYEIEMSTNGTDFSLLDIVGADVETYDATGLTTNTHYWFRIRAYNDTTEINSHYSNTADDWTSVTLTVSARGDGSGVAAFMIKVSSALELRLSGSARFYTDAAGTTGESTNTTVAATGSLVTKYIKCPSGTCNLQFMDANYLIGFGHAVGLGSTNPVWGRSTGGTYDANTPGLNASNWVFPYCVDIGIAYSALVTFATDIAGLSPSLERACLVSSASFTGELADLGTNCELFYIEGANTISGNISTMSSAMKYFQISGSNTVSGNISSLPAGMIDFRLQGSNTLTGDIADLPHDHLITFLVGGSNTITGSVADLDYTGCVLTTFQVYGNNSISGAPSDIASSITRFELQSNSSTFSGAISGFPSTLDYISLSGTSMSLTGSTSDLASGILSIIFSCPNTISGNVSGFPSTLTYINIAGSNTITGDVSGLPSGLTQLYLAGNNTISGDISGLPANMTTLNVSGSNTISGNISGFSTAMTYVTLTGSNTVSGNVSGIKSALKYIYIYGSNTITGAISSIPSTVIQLVLEGLNTLSGDLADISNSINYFSVKGSNTISNYTSGKTWSNSFIYTFLINPVSPGGLDSTEIDNLFIDLDTSWTTTRSQTIDMRGTNAAPTAASASARASLITKGRTIYTN